MILIDTNVVSEMMRPSPDHNVVRWLDSRPVSDVWVSAITKAEIYLGIAILPDGKRKTMILDLADQMFHDDFFERCLPFDSDAARNYADIVAERKKMGRPISVEDAQIAAICRVASLTLATRNLKDFSGIQGLYLVNPWTAI